MHRSRAPSDRCNEQPCSGRDRPADVVVLRPSVARAALAALTVLAASGWSSHLSEGSWSCPSLSVAGVPCPCCGLTRSVLATLDRDLAVSLAFNPAGPLLVTAVVMAALRRRATAVPALPVMILFGLVGIWNLTFNPTF